VVDCASLPEALIESELFGVEKGAFTGADRSRPGKLESAQGGTLFLDEIGNISLSVQAKLLQFLQDFTVQRLGGNRQTQIHTRIIAATNRPLDGLVKQGKFREDLYFRLNTVKLTVPPLRERKEDIPDLCAHFLLLYNQKYDRAVRGISQAAYQRLMAYPWPGNIRELENVIQKAVLFCKEEQLKPENLDLTPRDAREIDEKALEIPVKNTRALKKDHLIFLLKKNNGIARWAAREGGISEATFFRKLRKFGIKRGSFTDKA
jgi:transcriptional regulator with PAS, ATPase and Fis domain